MAEPHQEHLVVLDTARAESARAALESLVPVTQVLPPRFLLVRADDPALPGIRRIAGVIGLFATAPADLPAGLTPEERVFVAAWVARSKSKTRPGEGLHWDAPGFDAPDAPTDPDDAPLIDGSTRQSER